MEERTDAELVALARAGDKGAFGQLIERYMHMAQRVALGRIADSEVALQLSQEAMLQAYLSLKNLRDADRFRSWLYGIVRNVCRSHVRDQKGRLTSLQALGDGPQIETSRLSNVNPPPQAVVEERELQREVLAAIQGLPPKSRAAALLFYYEGLSVIEIASTLGVSASAVKGRLYRARQQLREPLWPVYLERAPEERSRRGTVTTEPSYREVIIADVIERQDRQEPAHVLVLLDQVGRRILPLWISPVEGGAILRRLYERDVCRPQTHDLMSSLLQAVGATVQEVRVEALRQDIFFAVILLRVGDVEHEVDARPSDAIALALRVGCPIYAAEAVLESGGTPIPESAGEPPESGRDVAQFVQSWEEESEKGGLTARPTNEEIQKRRQAIRQRLSDLIFTRTRRIQIGPDPNLCLSLAFDGERGLPVSTDQFAAWLSDLGHDWATGVTTTLPEIWHSYFPWASHQGTQGDERTDLRAGLSARGDLADQEIIPVLWGLGGERKGIHTFVWIESDGAAAMAWPPGQKFSLVDANHSPDRLFEVYVRQLGPGPHAAHCLVASIQEWDRTGRPQP